MTIATDFYDRIFNQVNTIVEAAINHGGDVGGPYYSSPKKLEESMVSLVNELNCFDYMVAYLDEYKHIPKIISKEEYFKITHPNGEFDF